MSKSLGTALSTFERKFEFVPLNLRTQTLPLEVPGRKMYIARADYYEEEDRGTHMERESSAENERDFFSHPQGASISLQTYQGNVQNE